MEEAHLKLYWKHITVPRKASLDLTRLILALPIYTFLQAKFISAHYLLSPRLVHIKIYFTPINWKHIIIPTKIRRWLILYTTYTITLFIQAKSFNRKHIIIPNKISCWFNLYTTYTSTLYIQAKSFNWKHNHILPLQLLHIKIKIQAILSKRYHSSKKKKKCSVTLATITTTSITKHAVSIKFYICTLIQL